MASLTKTAGRAPAAILRETAVLLAVASLVPFLVHLLPWGGARPLGVYLLPLFWTTCVALHLRGPLPALLIGLAAAVLNAAVTGLPSWAGLSATGLELAGFVAAASVSLALLPRLFLWAPIGWLAGKALSLAVLSLVSSPGAADPAAHWARSAGSAVPGLVVLALIAAALARFYPRTDPSPPAHFGLWRRW
jgi:hypothetical protein